MIHLNDLCEHHIILLSFAVFIGWNFIMELAGACYQFALTQWQIRKILKEGCKVIETKLDSSK